MNRMIQLNRLFSTTNRLGRNNQDGEHESIGQNNRKGLYVSHTFTHFKSNGIAMYKYKLCIFCVI